MRPDLSDERTRINTVSLVVIAAIAAGVALMYARTVLVPFVLAIFIYLIVSPVLDFQVIRLKFARPVAVIITLLFVIIILSILFLFTAQAIQTIVSKTAQYSSAFGNLSERITDRLEGRDPNSSTEFENADPNSPTRPEDTDPNSPMSRTVRMLEKEIVGVLQKQIAPIVSNTFGTVFGFLTSFFLVAIFVIFLLVGRNPYIVRSGILGDIDKQVRKYITIKTGASIITGVLVWLILTLFGLELASVFGLLAFMLNFIPSIGSVVATLLPIPIAVAQFDNPWHIMLVVLLPGIVQMFIGNGVEPKLMGKGLHLHPVTILLALSFWGLIWGIAGMFLAVPMTAVVRIVLMQFRTLRPVGRLMDGQIGEAEPEASVDSG
jgi:AI-2 transport protein TqsA